MPDFSSLMLGLLQAGLTNIPAVGSFASLLVGSIWPGAGQSLLDQVKDYVDEKLHQLEDQVKTEAFRSSLMGLKLELDEVASTGSENEYKSKFIQAVSTSTYIRGSMKADDGTELQPIANMLPYIVTFSLLRLALLRYEYVNYERIYDAPNKNQAADYEMIWKEIDNLDSIVRGFPEKALQWRRSCITMNEYPWHPNPLTFDVKMEVRDSSIGYLKVYLKSREELNARADYEGRLADCETRFREDAEKLVSGRRWYASFLPGSTYAPAPRKAFTWYRIGEGLGEAGAAFDDRAYFERYGRITRIRIWAGDWLDGIQVWYGDASPGLRGREGGSLNEIRLADGEYLVVMGGVISSYVTSFWVRTNRGQGPCGGSSTHPPGVNDNYWVGYSTNPTLSPGDGRVGYFVGRSGGSKVTQLKVGFYSETQM